MEDYKLEQVLYRLINENDSVIDQLKKFRSVYESASWVKSPSQLDIIYDEIKELDTKKIRFIIEWFCDFIEVPEEDFDNVYNWNYEIKYDKDDYLYDNTKKSFCSKLYNFLFKSNHENNYYETIDKHRDEPVQLFRITTKAIVNYDELFREILFREIIEEAQKRKVPFSIHDRGSHQYSMFHNCDKERSIIQARYSDPNAPYYLVRICLKYIIKNKYQVREIIHRNPKVTNYTLDIINLICPVIAQKYAGIPALAIVGAITLLFKQGINRYLE